AATPANGRTSPPAAMWTRRILPGVGATYAQCSLRTAARTTGTGREIGRSASAGGYEAAGGVASREGRIEVRSGRGGCGSVRSHEGELLAGGEFDCPVARTDDMQLRRVPERHDRSEAAAEGDAVSVGVELAEASVQWPRMAVLVADPVPRPPTR